MDVSGHDAAGFGGCLWYEQNGECGDWEDWLTESHCCVCGYGIVNGVVKAEKVPKDKKDKDKVKKEKVKKDKEKKEKKDKVTKFKKEKVTKVKE
jgi:hypothetical protein